MTPRLSHIPRAAISLLLLSLFCATAHPCLAQQTVKGLAMPYLRNFSAQQYHGHNRNFDVECDGKGRTFVANFEGLLVYDNVEWHMYHTPGISRITTIFRDKDNLIWFGGYNTLGYVNTSLTDTIQLSYTVCDTAKTANLGEVNHIWRSKGTLGFSTSDGKTYTLDSDNKVHPSSTPYDAMPPQQWEWKGTIINDSLRISPAQTFLASNGRGIIAIDNNARLLYDITGDEGLCSHTVNAIAYDGKGTLWGVTDNGIFHLNTQPAYTHYGPGEGLNGQIITLLERMGTLYAGTLQGLFRLTDGRFEPVSDLRQACWSLTPTDNGGMVASTANGLYAFTTDRPARMITPRHSLSALFINESLILSGELDGIYRVNYPDGISQIIDRIPNVVRFRQDKDGTIKAINLYGKTYALRPGSPHFVECSDETMTLVLDYTDGDRRHWTTQSTGTGITCSRTPASLAPWLHALRNKPITSLTISNGVAWMGTTNELIRLDLDYCIHQAPIKPTLYIRSHQHTGGSLHVTFSNDKIDPMGSTKYSYRLHDDAPWSEWSDAPELHLLNQRPGFYTLTVRSMDAYGNITESQPLAYRIPAPWFFRWYMLLAYLCLIILTAYTIFYIRTRNMAHRQRELEKIVDQRTSELRKAQTKLIRQEREATVGKLTKGLIDRILNPMNYINNFSHLSKGLTKDLSDDLEDINGLINEDDNAAIDKAEFEDLYDDSLDVLSMLKQNLEKIEEHGMATTRTLKAMEEMLKERSGQTADADLCAIMQQVHDVTLQYYKKEIDTHHITIEWLRPAAPHIIHANAENITKAVMYLISNSIYALTRKTDGESLLRLSIDSTPDTISVNVFDTGTGIEESIHDKIFDPFFTTKPTAVAPGVGLYICQQIVQDHGGTITFKTTKNEYTEFTICLPLKN